MATSQKTRRVSAARYYREETRSRWEGRNYRPKPIRVDETETVSHGDTCRDVTFVAPNSDLLVRLRLRKNATSEQAIIEWLARRVIDEASPNGGVDIRPFASIMTFGAFTTVNTECSGVLHFQSIRFAEPGALSEAMDAWSQSGHRGLNPMDVFAFLRPGVHLPLGTNDTPQEMRQRQWAYVAVDLSRPLGSQLSAMGRYFGDLQGWSHQLAHKPIPRPAKRDTARDVLIFTLRHSQGASLASIAKRVFPREDKDSAKAKVKQTLRRLHTLMATLAADRAT